MSIPKIIHYCWYGCNELPEKEKRCIESWHKKLKGYKFILWNENNSNLNECNYVRQAYDNKQYAFVSDYFRVKVLYEFGGIYLDTDVELIKDFDHLLKEKAFLGFENRTTVGTAVMACESGADFVKQMVDYYETHNFVDDNGHLDITANVTLLNVILESKGMKRINTPQLIGNIRILERNVLYPKKKEEDYFLLGDETISIHHMNVSWLTERQKRRGRNKLWLLCFRPVLRKMLRFLNIILGKQTSRSIETYVRNKLR